MNSPSPTLGAEKCFLIFLGPHFGFGGKMGSIGGNARFLLMGME